MNWIEDRITDYYKWLRERTHIRTDEATGWSAMSTPFLGAYNDPMEIYLRRVGDNIEMSDDGVTLANLSDLGVYVSRSNKRKEWLTYILRNYGVSLDGEELRIIATDATFPQKKHALLCAMIEVSEMEMFAEGNVATIFREDVRTYFDQLELVYTPQFIMKGSTGLEFTFDFQFAGRKKETVVKSFTSLTMTNVPNFLFSWEDIKRVRENEANKQVKSLAIVNDLAMKLKPEYVTALQQYGCDYMPWSAKDTDECKERLLKLTA